MQTLAYQIIFFKTSFAKFYPTEYTSICIDPISFWFRKMILKVKNLKNFEKKRDDVDFNTVLFGVNQNYTR